MNADERRDTIDRTGDSAPRSSETGVTTKTAADRAAVGFTGILSPLGIVDRGMAIFEAVVLAIGTLALACASVANVAGRFLFGQSLYFAEELSQFLVILITFAGIGFAARHGRHIRMSAIYDQLPDLGRKITMILIALVTAAIMFVLAWYSYFYVSSVYGTGRISPVTRIPVFLTLIWLPIGFAITGIQYILTAIANLTRPDVYLSVSVIDTYEDTETQV
ncbi:TRAP transporter small permease [Fulvimarina sp. 2208YS6-2-32]|uniref:TRAP transporter small permease protein n=1 Tax=Fulvimarina uroteuthidis TaxID=3098149 RepID=A0ABU5I0I3_9HYPH|nr:TRAP transporter small permease [Fulvimarina sp. 2208YS6-2-32]MDY8108830.1 TRAP transporter small permease [Fulvimarina sp. 2208YS6-2-32]